MSNTDLNIPKENTSTPGSQKVINKLLKRVNNNARNGAHAPTDVPLYSEEEHTKFLNSHDDVSNT